MILRNDKSRFPLRLRRALIVAAVLLAGLLVVFLLPDQHQGGPAHIFTSMEEVAANENGGTDFLGKNGRFSHGETRSDKFARSGKFSCLVHSGQVYGPTWVNEDLVPGELYEARVWRRSDAGDAGRLVADGSWGAYASGEITGNEHGEWEELSVAVRVPSHLREGKLRIYVWNSRDEYVWFDDLSIRRISPAGSHGDPGYFASDSLRHLNIILGEKGLQKLERIRQEALRKGMLMSGGDDWVNAKLEEGKDQIEAELRLKGDWTDHLKGDKWSYRISVERGAAWNRLITFSVQNPKTRDFLSEWVYHKLLRREDILAPRYDFISLSVNNVSKGLYAYEEHFVKQLPEYSLRREGPILKFVEDGFWDVMDRALSNDNVPLEDRIPIFRSSNIEAFKMGRTLKDSTLQKQFEIAQNLMFEYKTGQKSIWDVFDVPRMARFYAIVDLNQAYHGFIWHNQRLYYNPVISRLEPIGFDGFTSTGPYKWIKRPFLGYARNFRHMKPSYREQMFERLFEDEKFLELYVGYLSRFTSKEYIGQFFAEIGPELNQREEWVRREWPDYKYDRKYLYSQADRIRLMMMPMKRTSVKAHLQALSGGRYRYKIFNYHCLPVRVLGVGGSETQMDAPLETQPLLPAYQDEFPAEYADAYAPAKGDWIFFRVPGIDSVFSAEIMQWKLAEAITPEQELFSELRLDSSHIYQLDEPNKTVRFLTGNYKTDRDILIPPGYSVLFEEGVELDLIKKAKFISKSPVEMYGTEARPIRVFSSDGTANGFTVLQPEGENKLRYVVFDNLNTLSYKGWNLTGAVTFYETDVDILHSRFINNNCEDGLNLIRCIFDMRDSYVGHTFGDGFDADYCSGRVIRCFFYKTTNDGMDFSGSDILIDKTEVDGAGDKGISLGEESKIRITSATVRNSVIGLAAKDLTDVDVTYIELFDNQRAIAAYQKKPEYGPATITIRKSEIEGNGELHWLQNGSTLKLGETIYEGKK